MVAFTEIRGGRLVEICDMLAFTDFILPLFYGHNTIPNLSEDTKALCFLRLLTSVEFGVCKLRESLGSFWAA